MREKPLLQPRVRRRRAAGFHGVAQQSAVGRQREEKSLRRQKTRRTHRARQREFRNDRQRSRGLQQRLGGAAGLLGAVGKRGHGDRRLAEVVEDGGRLREESGVRRPQACEELRVRVGEVVEDVEGLLRPDAALRSERK